MSKKTNKAAATKARRAVIAPRQAVVTPAAEPANPKRDLVVLRAVGARYAANPAAASAAFASLASEATRASLGAKTKAKDVLRDGAIVAVAVDAAFTKAGAIVSTRYAKTRFRFLLDALEALALELAAPVAGAARGEATSTAATREAAARATRTKLLAVMKSYAGHRDVEVAALDAATLAAGSDADSVAASIDSIVTLARAWLARSDETSRILREAAGFGAGLVDAAARAAAALTEGAANVTLAGRSASQDPPLVNLAEGGVLVELLEVNRVFTELNEETHGVIRKLPLGNGIRRLVGSRPKAKAIAAPASPAPAPEPGDGAA